MRVFRVACFLAVGLALRLTGWAEVYSFTTINGLADDAATIAAREARFTTPVGVATDPAGNIYLADAGAHVIRRMSSTGAVTRLAGRTGVAGAFDGRGDTALFNGPTRIAVDGAGNIYVADTNNHVIRQISPVGQVSTLAGTLGQQGGANGTGAAARFNEPRGIVVTPNGVIFVADTVNRVIRRIDGGTVSTFAGRMGLSGRLDGTGIAAGFEHPLDLALEPTGDLLVLDGRNGIRRISPDSVVTNGVVTTLAGRGESDDGPIDKARFFDIAAVVGDNTGNLYVLERTEGVVRKISSSGMVSTLAGRAGVEGSTDGAGRDARFRQPRGLAVAEGGVVYVADSDNHTIRRISPSGEVNTLAGVAGEAGNATGAAAAARFRRPSALVVTPTGDIMVADTGNAVIRRVTPNGDVTNFAGSAGVSGSANGTGATARFSSPNGLAVDPSGALFLTEEFGRRLRRITPAAVVSTLAGGDVEYRDGLAAASFELPIGPVTDPLGNVLIAEALGTTIRRISPDGVVITVAGNYARPGLRDGVGMAAQFDYPLFIGADPAGNVYTGDGRILRKGVRQETSALVNLSLRCLAGEGAAVPIAGYALKGPMIGALLVRGVGPALRDFGVGNALDDPKLRVYRGTQFQSEFDNWTGGVISAIAARNGAFPLPTGSRDAAYLASTFGEPETVQLTGGTGVGLIEIYDVGASDYVRLVNLSGRAQVGAGGDLLIAGFSIAGNSPRTVLIRGVGPTLTALGVSGALSDPRLELYRGNEKIAENDNWGGSPNLREAFAAVGAFALDANSSDATLLVTLPPGSYSAQVSGSGGQTGVALVEVYDVP